METLTDQDLLARLVAFDTTSAAVQPTKPLGDAVCNYLDVPSVRIERFDCGQDQENILVAAGPECTHQEGLLLCGHVDCVPADEPEWESDPFELQVQDDRLVARGACDMKGFDAIAINTLRRHADSGTLKEPLMLLLTCNEEIGTIGAGQFAKAWGSRPLPRRTIIGEPTSMQPIRGHKGHIAYTIAVGGRGGHTGFPRNGSNAIELAFPVLDGLKAFREDLASERVEWSALFPDVPQAVLTIANIRGGGAINITPESCLIKVGIRPLPGQDAEGLATRMLGYLPGARFVETSQLGGVGDGEILVAMVNNTPSYGLDATDPFYLEVKDIVGAGSEFGANYGTDAGRLVPVGCASVVLGPGDISVAHKPNEWMPRGEFEAAPSVLDAFIR